MTYFLSIFVYVWCTLSRPTRVVCPLAWHDDGVRRDGSLTCVPRPVNVVPESVIDAIDRSTQPPGEIHARVYCAKMQIPIAVDDRVIECR